MQIWNNPIVRVIVIIIPFLLGCSNLQSYEKKYPLPNARYCPDGSICECKEKDSNDLDLFDLKPSGRCRELE